MKKSKDSELSIFRRWMQAGFVVVTILLGLRHMLPGESSKGGAFDAFCPFGGIETLLPFLNTSHTLKTTNLLNFSVLLAVVGVSVVAGRAFCGWMCPLGTIQDWLAGLSSRLSGEKHRPRGKASKARFPVSVPAILDSGLRYVKYGVLAAILLASLIAVYPPLREFCPARAVFSFHLNTLLLGLVLLGFVSTSMLVKRFSCKYLCPLGAGLAVTNKFSLIRPHAELAQCNACGRCDHDCPVDIQAVPESFGSAECVRCLECLETCAISDVIHLQLG